jgi:hypothetical protein
MTHSKNPGLEDTAPAAGPMTAEAFEVALERFGAQLDAWPLNYRAQARALLEHSPRAERSLEAAKQVDELLARLPMGQPSAELQRRVAEIPLRFPQHRAPVLFPTWRIWLPGFAAALGLGLAVGFSTTAPLTDTVSDTAESTLGVASDDAAEDEELLALGDDTLWTDEGSVE